ncbi:MAG: hypothetical protein WCT54_03555 [Patescibacteria group bacterium]
MKKSFAFLSLFVASAGLISFVLGCQRQTTNEIQTIDDRQQTTGVDQQIAEANKLVATEPRALAYLLLTEGAKVTVTRGDQSRDGISEMELLEGDEVNVKSGEARLLYPNAGMTVLEQGTKVILIPDGEPKADGVGVQLILQAGKVWTRLEKLLGADEAMSVSANNVVATVRGTGFGVQFISSGVDITVADHQVRVATRTVLNTGAVATQSVLLAAGSGLTVNPTEINKMTDMRAVMLKNIRKLSDNEKQLPGYIFGTQKITPIELVPPVKPFIWSVPPVLSSDLLSLLQPTVISRVQSDILWYQENQTTVRAAEDSYLATPPKIVRFQAPLRDINLQEITPTTTPSVKGPSS